MIFSTPLIFLVLLFFRLLSIVFAAKPISIELNLTSDILFVDEKFIIDYSNAVLHANLKIRGTTQNLSVIFLKFFCYYVLTIFKSDYIIEKYIWRE